MKPTGVEGAEGRCWVEDHAPTTTSARKERVEVVAGEEVVETYWPHEEAGLHPIGGGCSRRREVDELEETSALLGSWSQLSCGKGGGRFQLILEVLKAEWTDCLGTTCVPKSRGWDMPRMRRGVGLRAGRHGEWHGPCSLRPKDSVSNSPSRRTSCPRRPASSTISTTSARLRRRRRRSGRAGRPARQAQPQGAIVGPTMLKWAQVGSLMGDGIWPESL